MDLYLSGLNNFIKKKRKQETVDAEKQMERKGVGEEQPRKIKRGSVE